MIDHGVAYRLERVYVLSFNGSNSIAAHWNYRKEKWDTSGASEALTRASASLPESTKTYMSSMFKREHLRGITVYFGIGEERPFYVEKTPSLLLERLRHNITFFYLNYMLQTAVLFCLTLIISPSAIVGIGLLALAWMWVIRASASGSLMVGSKCHESRTVVLVIGHRLMIVTQALRFHKRRLPLAWQVSPSLSCYTCSRPSFGGRSSRRASFVVCTLCSEMPRCTRIWTMSWRWKETYIWARMRPFSTHRRLTTSMIAWLLKTPVGILALLMLILVYIVRCFLRSLEGERPSGSRHTRDL